MASRQKRIQAIVKLQLKAGVATPADKVGPALGQHGVNIGEFLRQYNDATRSRLGNIVPVEITIYADRTFSFELKTPPTSALIKQALGIESGSAAPNKTKVGHLTQEQLRRIARRKLADLETDDIEAAMRTVAGTARSMGVTVDP